ncbi:MAG: 6-phosphogluconolactonase [Thermodesulfobacteriota bacterium]
MSLFSYNNMEEASQALAQRICTAARQAMAWSSAFSLVLSGGSSPARLYQLLSEPTYADRLDWQHIHLFWGDERCVAPDHPHSNFLLAKERLLDHISMPAANIHRMPGEMRPEDGATSYQDDIRKFFAGAEVKFDFILLGLGSDGHTASLFPGTAGLQEMERDVIDVPAPLAMKPQVARLTLSLPAINRAREICFLSAARGKENVLKKITSGQGHQYPAAMVAEPDWYLAG